MIGQILSQVWDTLPEQELIDQKLFESGMNVTRGEVHALQISIVFQIWILWGQSNDSGKN
jgi:hypothetical protein